MHVVINGEKQSLEASVSIQQLLDGMGYDPATIALAIDGAFIPRYQYPSVAVQDNQVLDIVAPMQGG